MSKILTSSPVAVRVSQALVAHDLSISRVGGISPDCVQAILDHKITPEILQVVLEARAADMVRPGANAGWNRGAK